MSLPSSFQVCKGRLLVERLPPKTLTAGGIELVQARQRAPDVGVVVRVGSEILVEPGDLVWWASYAGLSIQIEEVPYLILQGEDVVAYQRGEPDATSDNNPEV